MDKETRFSLEELRLIEKNMPIYKCNSGEETEKVQCRRCFLLWIERFPDEVKTILAVKPIPPPSKDGGILGVIL